MCVCVSKRQIEHKAQCTTATTTTTDVCVWMKSTNEREEEEKKKNTSSNEPWRRYWDTLRRPSRPWGRRRRACAAMLQRQPTNSAESRSTGAVRCSSTATQQVDKLWSSRRSSTHAVARRRAAPSAVGRHNERSWWAKKLRCVAARASSLSAERIKAYLQRRVG